MKPRAILVIGLLTALTYLGLYVFQSPLRVLALGGLVMFLFFVLSNLPPKHKEFTLDDQIEGAARGGRAPPKLPEPDISRQHKERHGVRQLRPSKMSTEKVLEEFRAPSKGRWRDFLTCGVLLLVWIGVELMIVKARLEGAHPLSGKDSGGAAVWTVSGIPLLIWLLWLLFGTERIALRKRYLTIRNEIAGLGLPFPYTGDGLAFNYDVEAITDIRLGKPSLEESKGLIEFNYNGSTIGFGNGLQTREALNIISIVK